MAAPTSLNTPASTQTSAKARHVEDEIPADWRTLIHIFIFLMAMLVFQHRVDPASLACLGTLLVATLGIGRWVTNYSRDTGMHIAMPEKFRMLTTALTIFIAYSTMQYDYEPLKLIPISLLLASSIGIGTWMGVLSATFSKPLQFSDDITLVIKAFLMFIGYLAYHDLDHALVLTGLCFPLGLAVGIGAWMAAGEALKMKTSSTNGPGKESEASSTTESDHNFAVRPHVYL